MVERLEEFASEVGGTLETPSPNLLVLRVSDFTVHIERSADAGTLKLSTRFAMSGDELEQGLYPLMLGANGSERRARAGVLGIDEETGDAVVRHAERLDAFEGDGLEVAVSRFVLLADEWRSVVDAYRRHSGIGGGS